VDGISAVTGAKRRSRLKQIFGKLDPMSEVEEDLVSAVANGGIMMDKERKDSASVVEHVENMVYVDVDDDKFDEKEVEVEVDSSAEEDASAEVGIRRKRTIRVLIRSRAFL
jgi:hypothetical protein